MIKKIACFTLAFAMTLSILHSEAYIVHAEENTAADETLFETEGTSFEEEDYAVSEDFTEEFQIEDTSVPDTEAVSEETTAQDEEEVSEETAAQDAEFKLEETSVQEEEMAIEGISAPEEEAYRSAEASGTTEDGFVYDLVDGSITITGYTGSDTQLQIPSKINGYDVTCIGSGAFEDNDQITSVQLPQTLKSIEAGSFYGCTKLEGITIPEGVKTIGDAAFHSCISLYSVSLPSTLTQIGDYAFSFCFSLMSFSVSENNSAFTSPDGVLYNKNMTSLEICPAGREGEFSVPESVVTIKSFAFMGCLYITSFILPAGLESIGEEAFTETEANEGFIVDEGNMHFSAIDGVLYNGDGTRLICCPSQKEGEFSIPDGVTVLGQSCFDNCRKITSITVPEGVTRIEAYAFYQCKALGDLTLPLTLQYIGEEICFECESLTDIFYNGTYLDYDQITIEKNDYEGDCLFPLDKWHINSVDLTDAEITLSPSSYTYHGSPCEPKVSGIVLNGKTLKLTEGTDYTLDYEDNDKVGTATAIISGEGHYYGEVRKTYTIKEGVIPATDITLDRSEAEIAATETLKLNATLSPAESTSAIIWESTNEKIAAVDENGLVTANQYGQTTIIATAGDLKATCKIRVLFKDVANHDKSYFEPVYWAVGEGITKVTIEFRPDDPVNRGEFTAFLYRLAGKPKVSKITNKFSDVNKDTKFAKEISWAVEQGVIKGYSDGTFRSTDNITRAQVAIMLWRYAGKPEPKTKISPFQDVEVNKTDTSKAILWGSENGIIKGSTIKSKKYFLPKDNCTRGQTVTFMYRYSHLK